MNDFQIGRGAQMVSALTYMHYCQARLFGKSAEDLTHLFPRAAQFEKAYQEKLKSLGADE